MLLTRARERPLILRDGVNGLLSVAYFVSFLQVVVDGYSHHGGSCICTGRPRPYLVLASSSKALKNKVNKRLPRTAYRV
jgi:hypothetical protein